MRYRLKSDYRSPSRGLILGSARDVVARIPGTEYTGEILLVQDAAGARYAIPEDRLEQISSEIPLHKKGVTTKTKTAGRKADTTKK